MIRFIKFFLLFFVTELAISIFASSIVILIITFPEFKVWLTSSIQFSSIMIIQIIIRNLLGNYYFSWKLINYLQEKEYSHLSIVLLNSASVIGVYFVLSFIWYIRGEKFGPNELVFTYQIGIPMLVGIVGSSFVMVWIIKNIVVKKKQSNIKNIKG